MLIKQHCFFFFGFKQCDPLIEILNKLAKKKNRTFGQSCVRISYKSLLFFFVFSLFNLVECLLTLAREQDLWSRDFWKSKRACEAIELGHCWGGIKLVPSTALSVSVYYWFFMWLFWMCSSAPPPSTKKNLFSMCVCTCNFVAGYFMHYNRAGLCLWIG